MSNESRIIHPDDTESVIGRYQKRIAEYGTTLPSLNSGSIEKQRIRHEIHASALRCAHPRILDIGCGLGSFYEYLAERGLPCQYTGYDIVPEYVEYCRSRFPEAEFVLRNIFSDGIGGEFDTIVLSQVLNNRYQKSDNNLVMQEAIRAAYTATRSSVSIDMLSAYVDVPSSELYYYSPEAMFAFAKTITRRVILRHDYRPFEFCLQLFHESAEGYVA